MKLNNGVVGVLKKKRLVHGVVELLIYPKEYPQVTIHICTVAVLYTVYIFHEMVVLLVLIDRHKISSRILVVLL